MTRTVVSSIEGSWATMDEMIDDWVLNVGK